MSTDILLQNLRNVKRTGKDHGIASCPTANHAHGDRHPSMTWRIRDDRALLIYCAAGCTAHEIVSAVGLELSDLFPPRAEGKHSSKPDRRPFPAADILRAIAFESTLVLIAAADLLAGNPFNEFDRTRLALAVGRIQAALQAGGFDHG
ncbi:MAG: DNA primase [Candidatus Nitrotoga sp.]